MLLQRLGHFGGALLHLVKQLRIADGDHRLRRESLEQGDLLGAEPMRVAMCKRDCTYGLAVLDQRHTQGAVVIPAPGVIGPFIVGIAGQIRDIDRFPQGRHAPRHRVLTRRHRVVAQYLLNLRRRIADRHHIKQPCFRVAQ